MIPGEAAHPAEVIQVLLLRTNFGVRGLGHDSWNIAASDI